jgi:DNA-directed RNA polymerase specialized sigma24 family protein
VSLTEALRASAPEAYGLLYDEYADRLYAYGHIMVGDEATDVVRDAFIAVARHPGTAPADDAGLPVWLFALTRSECVRRGALTHKAAAAPSADPMRRTLTRLRPEHREVLALSRTLEVPEIARVIGVAGDTAEMLLRVSRRRLEQAAASVLGTARDEAMLAALAAGKLDGLLAREYAPPPRERDRVLFSCAAAERAADGALLFDRDGMPIPVDALFGTAEDVTHPFAAVSEEPATAPRRPVDPDPDGEPQVRRVRPRTDHARPRQKKESFISRRRDGLVEVAGLAACVAAATGALALWPSPHGNGGTSNMDGTSLLIHRGAASRPAAAAPTGPGANEPSQTTTKPGASPSPSRSTSPPAPPATSPARPAPPATSPPGPAHPTPTPTPSTSSPTTTPTTTPTPTPTPTGPGGESAGSATPTPEPSGS